MALRSTKNRYHQICSSSTYVRLDLKGKTTEYLPVLWSFCRVPFVLLYFVLYLPVVIITMQIQTAVMENWEWQIYPSIYKMSLGVFCSFSPFSLAARVFLRLRLWRWWGDEFHPLLPFSTFPGFLLPSSFFLLPISPFRLIFSTHVHSNLSYPCLLPLISFQNLLKPHFLASNWDLEIPKTNPCSHSLHPHPGFFGFSLHISLWFDQIPPKTYISRPLTIITDVFIFEVDSSKSTSRSHIS